MEEILEQIEDMEEDTQKNKFLSFNIENEAYGIEIKFVTEIIGIQPITQVPEMPEYIKGIINLRGKIIPVMDVRLRFKKQGKVYDDRTCIIVVDINDVSVGLIVDTVAEVMSISEGNIVLPPSINKNYHNRFVKGIGKDGERVKLILDCDRLLSDDEADMFLEASLEGA